METQAMPRTLNAGDKVKAPNGTEYVVTPAGKLRKVIAIKPERKAPKVEKDLAATASLQRKAAKLQAVRDAQALIYQHAATVDALQATEAGKLLKGLRHVEVKKSVSVAELDVQLAYKIAVLEHGGNRLEFPNIKFAVSHYTGIRCANTMPPHKMAALLPASVCRIEDAKTGAVILTV